MARFCSSSENAARRIDVLRKSLKERARQIAVRPRDGLPSLLEIKSGPPRRVSMGTLSRKKERNSADRSILRLADADVNSDSADA